VVFGLGIDTGGTYTDAVLMDVSGGRVVAKAKALTTRDDLSAGIANAVGGMRIELPCDIGMVSLSSTLATNSIVEGKGCSVGLISIGREFDRSIPVDMYACVSGGHTLSGAEAEPLDEQHLRDSILSMRDRVDGIAITSYLSVRNPDHENRARAAAGKLTDIPTVCGHELSSSLGFNERAVTSVMNARLIPVIRELMDSVKKVMEDRGISAPLMVMRGDGSIMSEEVAAERPIETILSGPAASLVGAKALTGRENAIVMDMGGTTTDIGILRNGRPRLEKEGAIIGGRRTRVMAVEVSTSGIGGDSRIVVNGGKFVLTPMRAMPLCIAAGRWPQIIKRIKAAADAPGRNTPESLDISRAVQDIEFFVKIKEPKDGSITETDRKFLDIISGEPFSVSEAADILGIHPYMINIPKLEKQGMIQRIGLTPTDILHADGSYREFNPEPSVCGADYACGRMEMARDEFLTMAKAEVVDRISEELLKKLFLEETGSSSLDEVSMDLIRKSMSGRDGLDYGCRITLNKPIVGIGAPVSAYFPAMAKKFGAELLLPVHSEVGNAVGAVTGSIIETMEALIKPAAGDTNEDPKCTVFSVLGKTDFETLTEALAYVKEEGGLFVYEKAVRAGADHVRVSADVKHKKYELGTGYGAGSVLLETNVKITAAGKPKQFAVAIENGEDEYGRRKS
jgi:N-methylhydantoinase A/oxoprolinase/acetone carboxylase beta subunit